MSDEIADVVDVREGGEDTRDAISVVRLAPTQLPPIEVDVNELEEPRRRDLQSEEVQNANWLSKGLLVIFGGSLALNLLVPLILLIAIGPQHQGYLTAYKEFLKEASTFTSTVFGPLLAFVLGYYFGESRRK